MSEVIFRGRIRNAGHTNPFSPVGFVNIMETKTKDALKPNEECPLDIVSESGYVLPGEKKKVAEYWVYHLEDGVDVRYLFNGTQSRMGRYTGNATFIIKGGDEANREYVRRVLIESIGKRDFIPKSGTMTI